MSKDSGAAGGAHLRVNVERSTDRLAVEPRRALAVFRALNLAGDRVSSHALLSFAGRAPRGGPVTISKNDCAALAKRLRRSGYPLTNDGVRAFKMERGFSNAVRIGPDVASAYGRFAKGVETRLNINTRELEHLDGALGNALRILMVIGRDPASLQLLRMTLGVRDSQRAPDGVLLVGRVTAERLLAWTHARGWSLDEAGLRRIARACSSQSGGDETVGVTEAIAHFVAEAVLCRDEPAHDYTRYARADRTLNRRTILMLKSAERIGPRVRLGVLKGSYCESQERGAHPHKGGGVVDLTLGDVSLELAEAAVLALRQVGFAAWLRQRERESHIHAVAIGDRELAPAAAWQVGAYFSGRDGRCHSGIDPHRALDAKLPFWTARYRVPFL